jgi:hypothetical protein
MKQTFNTDIQKEDFSIFANTSDSRLEQSLYYRKALNHSTMDQKLLCVRQSGKSLYHIPISPVLIIKDVIEFRQSASVR